MNNSQKSRLWHYKVLCTHCGAKSSFDWSMARKASGMGYDMNCPACGNIFNFTKWQYVSTCPGCGHSFEVTMHSITEDLFAHQHQCPHCDGILNCSKDSPPSFIDLHEGLVIPFDASAGKFKHK